MRTWLVVAIALAAALGAAPASAQSLFGPLLAGTPAGVGAAAQDADRSPSRTAATDGLDSAAHAAGDAAGRALLAADNTGIVAVLLDARDLLDWIWMVPGVIFALTAAWWLLWGGGRGGASAAGGKDRQSHDGSAIEEAMARAAEAHAAKQRLLERAGVRRTPAAVR